MVEGKLITFEGINGGGKSCQARLLTAYLRCVTDRVVHGTRQPGDSSFGLEVRKLLVDQRVHRDAASLLIQADCLQHVHECIKPWLEQGHIVVCDRFVDSTTAYQVYGQGRDANFTKHLNQMATQGIVPDATFLLDLDPKIGLSRDKRTSRFYVGEELETYERLRNGYLEMAYEALDRFIVIDVNELTLQESFKSIVRTLYTLTTMKDILEWGKINLWCDCVLDFAQVTPNYASMPQVEFDEAFYSFKQTWNFTHINSQASSS